MKAANFAAKMQKERFHKTFAGNVLMPNVVIEVAEDRKYAGSWRGLSEFAPGSRSTQSNPKKEGFLKK